MLEVSVVHFKLPYKNKFWRWPSRALETVGVMDGTRERPKNEIKVIPKALLQKMRESKPGGYALYLFERRRTRQSER